MATIVRLRWLYLVTPMHRPDEQATLETALLGGARVRRTRPSDIRMPPRHYREGILPNPDKHIVSIEQLEAHANRRTEQPLTCPGREPRVDRPRENADNQGDRCFRSIVHICSRPLYGSSLSTVKLDLHMG